MIVVGLQEKRRHWHDEPPGHIYQQPGLLPTALAKSLCKFERIECRGLAKYRQAIADLAWPAWQAKNMTTYCKQGVSYPQQKRPG
jgi:hypothetical protein